MIVVKSCSELAYTQMKEFSETCSSLDATCWLYFYDARCSIELPAHVLYAAVPPIQPECMITDIATNTTTDIDTSIQLEINCSITDINLEQFVKHIRTLLWTGALDLAEIVSDVVPEIVGEDASSMAIRLASMETTFLQLIQFLFPRMSPCLSKHYDPLMYELAGNQMEAWIRRTFRHNDLIIAPMTMRRAGRFCDYFFLNHGKIIRGCPMSFQDYTLLPSIDAPTWKHADGEPLSIARQFSLTKAWYKCRNGGLGRPTIFLNPLAGLWNNGWGIPLVIADVTVDGIVTMEWSGRDALQTFRPMTPEETKMVDDKADEWTAGILPLGVTPATRYIADRRIFVNDEMIC